MFLRSRPSQSFFGIASISAVVLTLAACSAEKFSACESCADASAGTAAEGGSAGSAARAGAGGSGGSAVGGSSSGGTGEGGTRGGASGSGGSAGVGAAGSGAGGSSGAGMDGSAGSGPVDAGDRFPRTPVLDTFNRADGELQAAWLGNRSSFSVVNQALAYVSGACSPVLWETSFGVEQEVFATLSAVNNQADEINLVMKAQELIECELIEILYSPARRKIELHYCTGGQWQILDGISATLATGDKLGARFHADARVHIYVNGVRAAIIDASGYPHKARGGRIGVNCLATADGSTAWDDFGGG